MSEFDSWIQEFTSELFVSNMTTTSSLQDQQPRKEESATIQSVQSFALTTAVVRIIQALFSKIKLLHFNKYLYQI